MDKLRIPFFLIAAVLLLLVVLLECGSGFIIKPPQTDVHSLNPREIAKQYDADIDDSEVQRLASQPKPPGLAIPQMALLDGVMLFTVGLMGARYVLSDRVSGRLQGILSLIVSLLVILGGIVLLFADFAKLLVMVSLFLSAPFGTIAYLVIWGFFNRGGAEAMLGASMFLKFGFVIMLLLAQQGFVQNKGLVVLILVSLVANLVVSFLHGLVPVVLVSITDAIGAMVVVILALIWAIVMLIESIIAIIRAVI